ncbi:MAG TPA: hypothetical protein VME43_22475 [Bryobacteraceae bacterium]|nr:hypothetical protein [Bryobacteraceae bacterium]
MRNDTLLVSPAARPSRVVRFLATQMAGVAACAFLAFAQTNVLPLPASQASTVPSNGDVNPYGVAFVPSSVPTDGTLQQGSILVSNFNNNLNLQGTGTTIVQISPQGKTSLFFTSTQSGVQGLSAALGILSDGIVIAGYLPSTDGTFETAGPGGLLFIDRHGVLLGSLTNTTDYNGPWGMAVNDRGNGIALIFISNVEAGTITRLELNYSASGESAKVLATTVIGSGFMHSGDPAAFEVGPSGLAYDPTRDILYVASEVDSAVYAIERASTTNGAGTGTLIYQDLTHLHGPLDLALAPNGHLVVANSDGRNADPNQPSELVEFTTGGKFVAQYSVDPNNGGAFGLAIESIGLGVIRVAAVDDNQNVLNMWMTIVN